MAQYWLYDWFDECGVRAQPEIVKALKSSKALKRLIEFRERAPRGPANSQQILPQRSIVVGRSLDLSGAISCGGYGCLRRDIDVAFQQVWHYFDGIVVAQIRPSMIYSAAENDAEGDYDRDGLLNQLRIALYIREVGAEPWVIFADKDREFSDQEWSTLVASLKVEGVFEGQRHDKLVQKIAKNTHFNVRPAGAGAWKIWVSSSYFKTPQQTTIYQAARPTIEDLSSRLLRTFGTAAIQDVATARDLSLSLVQPTPVPWINGKGRRPTQEEVALQLRLPVFSNLDVRDFLKLRDDEWPAFEKFRKGLSDEIKYQLNSAAKGSSAQSIARNVENSYLLPGLADIEQRHRTSRRALARKGAASLTIASSAATVSAISSVPMMIAGSVIALGSAVPLAPLIGSYIDETTKEIPMDKLYFLWRLKKQGKHWMKHR